MTKEVYKLSVVILLGVTLVMTIQVSQARTVPRSLSAAALKLMKDTYKLKVITEADPNDKTHASGIIRVEDEKKGTLLLITSDVCKKEGASGTLFVMPYHKDKLNDPANCDGKLIDRYRVEQQ